MVQVVLLFLQFQEILEIQVVQEDQGVLGALEALGAQVAQMDLQSLKDQDNQAILMALVVSEDLVDLEVLVGQEGLDLPVAQGDL